MDDETPEELSGPVPIPITGELDLHTFRPQDVKEVVPAYLEACRDKGILVVRIVHGKGIGNLRRTVQAIPSVRRRSSVCTIASPARPSRR